MTDTFAPTLTPAQDVAASVVSRRAARDQYQSLCDQAFMLLDRAATLATIKGLGDIHAAKARAAGKLCAELHTIVGEPDGDDFRALVDDVEHICRAVDPLLAAIGEEAQAHCPGAISDADYRDCFASVIETAVSGQALYLLDRCAEETDEALNESDERLGD